MRRGRSPWRDWPLIGWLSIAVVVALGHRWLAESQWLLLHLVFLGAVTHSIMVWSMHFAQTLLRQPPPPQQNLRLALLTLGSALVFVGVPTTIWPITLVGGSIVGFAVIWHGWLLVRMLRRALPARFRVTVRYYVAAAASLAVGAGFGIALAWGWTDAWHGRLLVAHALTNVLGWMGLTVTGTLLTLWPTMLRTRMDAAAEALTQRALPVLLTGIVVAVGGALAGITLIGALGLVAYLAGFALWAGALWRPLRAKPITEFAPASVLAALGWLVIGLTWAGWVLVSAADWAVVRETFNWPAAALAAGFGVQLLTGALSYLLPSVLGGGPSVVRAGQRFFNAGAGFRLVAINGGLVLWLAPMPSWVKVTGSLLALGAAASFLPIMVLGLKASLGARRALARGEEPEPPQPRPHPFSATQVIAGFAAVATAAVVGVGVDPHAAGVSAAPAATQVTPTGRTVRVRVEIIAMHYVPNSVTLNPGDALVVDLVNSDTNTHDLVIGEARTARLGPGEKATLDAGVIGATVQGYCSIVGHKQMGMVFAVNVSGATAPAATPADGGDGHAGHGTSSNAQPLTGVIDPVLAPLTPGEKVHQLTLTAQEVPLEVAPGVWQKRWTFNGRAPGPTLHGKVGDVFEITLVNGGTIGHSIDFHAGSLAPDRPMRTIQPGESLVYRFTATKAGIWLYHCSTMPMSTHIAAGMFGAVVIEPDGLPAVDRSYVLVQSETYLQTAAPDAASATEVNADAIAAEKPSYVAFNGIANGYDQAPLEATAGQRVRFWVLDAGPNRPSSFHIVGAQFDTVYVEGRYVLRRGRDAFGSTDGGSQALGLQAAQGGFVEAVFAEAGRYPMVTHIMIDAERGAHGYVQVR
ncbi:MAG: multicopper oxidase domain-containing protein [Micropruina sp.]|nr:multicopper oxidase domain-containing protein [Micropruina sp.]